MQKSVDEAYQEVITRLRQYTRHLDTCASREGFPEKCDCGLDELLGFVLGGECGKVVVSINSEESTVDFGIYHGLKLGNWFPIPNRYIILMIDAITSNLDVSISEKKT